jgi:hypothetical protein
MSNNKFEDRPRRLAVPRSRRLTIDVLHYHRQVPTCAHDRICDLSHVAAQREQSSVRIAWPLLFTKAFAIVAARHPELRQTYLRWPWPHLYQHPHSVGMIVTHRDVAGEAWLFWSRFSGPEKHPLVVLQQMLGRYQSEPAPEIFKRQWMLSALPTPLRRLCWWWTLNVSGQMRAKQAGTFVFSSIGSRGAEIQHPPMFLTCNLTFGPLDERGRSRVTLAYDHRIMDGRLIADCLAELEQTLNGAIADELIESAEVRRAA